MLRSSLQYTRRIFETWTGYLGEVDHRITLLNNCITRDFDHEILCDIVALDPVPVVNAWIHGTKSTHHCPNYCRFVHTTLRMRGGSPKSMIHDGPKGGIKVK